MAFALKLDAIGSLPKTPASDVKKIGWRGVMRSIQESGRVVVTNHDVPGRSSGGQRVRGDGPGLERGQGQGPGHAGGPAEALR